MSCYTSSRDTSVLCRITGRGLAWLAASFPLVGFATSIVLSLFYDFDGSAVAGCKNKVANYLPSISVAFSATPQRYIWRTCIALGVGPSLLLSVLYYYYFKAFPVQKAPRLYIILVWINSLLHVMENVALMGLTFVSSAENYDVHVYSFMSFIGFSQAYMALSIILFRWSRWGTPMSKRCRKSMKYKAGLFTFNLCSYAFAAYFFSRNNAYCEPGMYTMFALGEYLTVLSNIAFHSTCIVIDFHDLELGARLPLP